MNDDERVDSIRVILLKDWDPLGVGDNPNLADEYDSYIPAILRLLDSHCTVEQLEQYLLGIEKNWELTPDEAASRAAKTILETLRHDV